MGELPLIEAVKAGNLSAVATLLASGSEIHQQDEHGWASLHWAAGKGDAAVVGLLLQHGANALQVGRDQRTP
jgi:ankyrin repeat protein